MTVLESKPDPLETHSSKEARLNMSKANRIWKNVALGESKLSLLRTMKKKDVGTRKVEEFIIDLQGDKSKGKGKEANHTKKQ